MALVSTVVTEEQTDILDMQCQGGSTIRAVGNIPAFAAKDISCVTTTIKEQDSLLTLMKDIVQ
jgi:hypothetical protein